jgi:hypothetical protein
MKSATYVPQQVLSRAAQVAWITAYGAVTAEAFAEREQVSVAVASERLDEAVQRGLLKRESVLVGYSALYTVTSNGKNLARRYVHAGGYVYPKGLRSPAVSIKEARHMVACAGVRAALERRYADCRTIGELELARDERLQGRRLASIELTQARGRRSHCPDLVIWPPAVAPEAPAAPGEEPAGSQAPAASSGADTSGESDAPDTSDVDTSDAPPLPVAVEVELTIKAKAELVANVRAWARCRRVEAVIYFAETRAIEQKLLDAIDQCKAERRVVVNPLREILDPQPGFPLIDE